MKKNILIIFLISLFLSACGSYQVADVSRLTVGMTPDEVSRIMGSPIRKLSASYTQEGLQEIFEYRTYRNESYAVEFWNGRLSRYDFIYEEVPPTNIITPGRPVYPNRPYDPIRPQKPPKPTTPPRPGRPSEPTRPDNRPDSRPSDNTKPNRPNSYPEKNPRSNIISTDTEEIK